MHYSIVNSRIFFTTYNLIMKSERRVKAILCSVIEKTLYHLKFAFSFFFFSFPGTFWRWSGLFFFEVTEINNVSILTLTIFQNYKSEVGSTRVGKNITVTLPIARGLIDCLCQKLYIFLWFLFLSECIAAKRL